MRRRSSERGAVAILVIAFVLAGLCALSFFTHKEKSPFDSERTAAIEPINEHQESMR